MEETTIRTTLQAGFGKVNITPDFSVGIGGYSNAETRRSEYVEAPIYTTCIALEDGGETVLLFTVDNCGIGRAVADRIRESAIAATGVPADHIFVGATHSHSCPSIMNDEAGLRYQELFYAACAEAAKQALADLAPAAVSAGMPVFEGMNFVRHYLTANGTYAGSNFGSFKDNPAVAHAAPTDPKMVLVRFAREEKRDILLINWQGHPDRAREIGFAGIAPSYVGPLRDTVAAGTGMLVAYFTGADGNVNIDSLIAEEKHHLNWRQYGVKMATLVIDALENLQPVEGEGIRAKRELFEAEIDHSWDNMLEQANEVYDYWKATDIREGNRLGQTYGFTSAYQARAIRSRYNMEKTGMLDIGAARVGGIGFTSGTYEMFSESGTYVKENSPYAATVVITGNSSYIPSEAAFGYRCYEADTGFYAKGTAEKLAKRYVEMLEELK